MGSLWVSLLSLPNRILMGASRNCCSFLLPKLGFFVFIFVLSISYDVPFLYSYRVPCCCLGSPVNSILVLSFILGITFLKVINK
uniref:Uncharacterized protein n=1 Tax=Rhizophora mucronata TaxID=61149 RepID=A0A2P2JG73_RHIMU